ncbi:conserved hypothetical protein [Prosthecochloris aestuarii DSM 271]|uniref:Porin n=1 Tax=Prosthecochloris aestuarii (strain DSM 271 / SK 413) TaxID=290512 RepID=B4S3Z4_PROA2|nr:hypothetical protein [Prosthecochloris aestuarii]ACF46786.1 conserved hypothetical protein [Prosthecochloris aestuarii DSM 271]
MKRLLTLIAAALICMPAVSHAIEPSNIPQTMVPNIHGKSLTTPVAWGAANGVVFAGVGGTINAPYTDEADGAAAFGIGVGDPIKNLGAQITIVSLDLDGWEEYSMGVHLHHDFGGGTAAAIGVENVMLTEGGDADNSFYAVVSHGMQGDMFVSDSGSSRLHFSVGIGDGRFGDKSDMDIATGKGKHGTYVFGNVAYDMFDEFNAIVDWNGLNLNAGVSKTFWIDKYPVAVTLGAADLTDNSGDDVRFIFAVGTGFKI